MSTPTNRNSVWIDITVMILFIVVFLGGISSIFFSSSKGLTYTQLVIDVVGLGVSLLGVFPNLFKGLLGNVKITLSQGRIGVIRNIAITIPLLLVVLILQSVQIFFLVQTSKANPLASSSQFLFLTVGQAGTILSSPDGKNWSIEASGTSKNLQSVIWSDSRSLFLAVGDVGTILSSPDGKNWSTEASGTSKNLQG